MRRTFQATEAGTLEELGAIILGVAGEDHHLLFSRSVKVGDDQDWGPHLEYDDQLHSGYRLVRQCRVSRDRLEIDLARPMLSLPEVTGFDIGLRLTQAAFENLVLNLRRIFQDEEQLLLCEAE